MQLIMVLLLMGWAAPSQHSSQKFSTIPLPSTNIKTHLTHPPYPSQQSHFSTMAIALKTFLLSILLLTPMLSSGRVEQGFRSQDQIPPILNVKKDGMQYPKFSPFDQGGIRVINQRKLLVSVLDYDDTGPNPKHDPRKKPGHP